MAGAQTSEVDSILKGFTTDYPTVIGYVVLNSDGIPVKYNNERMPYDRAVMYAALMTDFVQNCKKCLRELLTGGESELANLRIRTKEGTEILALPAGEYTLIVIQNCTGKPWVWGDEEAAGTPAGGGE